MKAGTVALVVRMEGSQTQLVETLSDAQEILVLETALKKGDRDPLAHVQQLRELRQGEDEQFADYVESILIYPFVKADIRKQGLDWFRSKLRIEHYQKSESEATKVIAQFALKIYQEDPKRESFILAGPRAQVNVRIIHLPEGLNRSLAS
jgi:ATP-dependent Lon protease